MGRSPPTREEDQVNYAKSANEIAADVSRQEYKHYQEQEPTVTEEKPRPVGTLYLWSVHGELLYTNEGVYLQVKENILIVYSAETGDAVMYPHHSYTSAAFKIDREGE